MLRALAALSQEKDYLSDWRLDRAGLVTWKRKSSCPCRESNPDSSVVQPAAYTPYRLSYTSYKTLCMYLSLGFLQPGSYAGIRVSSSTRTKGIILKFKASRT